MIKSSPISVGIAPTLLVAPTVSGSSVVIVNVSSRPVFVGDQSVALNAGFEIPAGENYAMDLRPGKALYGIAAVPATSITILEADSFTARESVPQRVSLGSPVTVIGSPAKVASSVVGLGAGTDGALGLIRVGVWPDTEYVELVYDSSANGGSGAWVSKPQSLTAQSDQAYMGVNTNAYSYIGTNVAGGTTGSIGWTTRPLRRAAELYAAGLRAQVKLTGLIAGTGAPATFTVMPFFFQHDDGDAVVFSSDGSTAVGWLGTPVVSPANSTVTFKALLWQDILKNGLSGLLATSDVTKKNLWPRFYGKLSALNGNYGQVIDLDLQARWVG